MEGVYILVRPFRNLVIVQTGQLDFPEYQPISAITKQAGEDEQRPGVNKEALDIGYSILVEP